MDRVGAKLLVAVIPFHRSSNSARVEEAEFGLDEERIAILKTYIERDVIEVALHGYSHWPNPYAVGRQSEFAGLSYPEQRDLIRRGKSELEDRLGHPILAFVPPYNTYDLNTVAALRSVDIRLLSAGIDGPFEVPSEMLFLPGTMIPRVLTDMLSDGLPPMLDEGLLVVTIHSYDFTDSGESPPDYRNGGKQSTQVTLEQFERDIKEMQGKRGGKIVSYSMLLNSGIDLSSQRLRANYQIRRTLLARNALLPRASWIYPVGQFYYTARSAREFFVKQHCVALVFYGGLFLIAATTAFSVLRSFDFSERQLRIARLAAGTLFGLVFARAAISGLYIKTAIAATLLAGAFFGLHVLRHKAVFSQRVTVGDVNVSVRPK